MWYLVVLTIIFLVLYFRSLFWNKQPISNILGIRKKGVLDTPQFNKYCDLFLVMPPKNIEETLDYLQSKHVSYPRNALQIKVENAFINVYKQPFIQGCMISRKVIWKETKNVYFHEIYSDSNKIYRILFSTHLYLLYTKTKSSVSMFTSSYKLPFLVPMTYYSIDWIKSNTLVKHKIKKNSIVRAEERMLYDVYPLWKDKFPCTITPSIDLIVLMVKNKQLSVFYHYEGEVLCTLFFFKNSYEIEDSRSILDWIGTIRIVDVSIKNIISTLLNTFTKQYPIIRVHNISHTPFTCGYKKTYNYYYMYNYGIRRIPSSKCFFI